MSHYDSVSGFQRLCLNNGKPFSSTKFDYPRKGECADRNQFLISSPQSSQRLRKKRPRPISIPVVLPKISGSVSPSPSPAVTKTGKDVIIGSRRANVSGVRHGYSGTAGDPNSKRSIGCSGFGGKSPDPMRLKVDKAIRLYREELENLRAEHERDPNVNVKNVLPMLAARRVEFYWPNHQKRLGKVPGVEIGDEFAYRAELCVVGLHGHFSNGIDYIKKDGMLLATSIVASGRYPNLSSTNGLTYTGSGGNPLVSTQKKVHDQKLTNGNLALSNSKKRGTPVRVIRRKIDGSSFFYDGLYEVVEWWKEKGDYMKLVFKFRLIKLPNQ